MSALPPKADIRRGWDVRKVPIADGQARAVMKERSSKKMTGLPDNYTGQALNAVWAMARSSLRLAPLAAWTAMPCITVAR
jgi:hypothetical protein